MRRIIIATVAAALVAGTAYATNCPNEMKAVDATLTTTKLDAAKQKQVMDLRAKGEADHKAGKHADSMKALGEAKQLLGIK